MSKIKNVVLLGSTGSIGTQTIEVCGLLGIRIKALACKANVSLLEEQARRLHPEYVCVYDEKAYADLSARLADTDIKTVCGEEGLCFLAALPCDAVVNSVVGMVGLRPTLAALEAGNNVALANKETLVTGGSLVTKLAKEKRLSLLPIDSEHSAIFQSLMGNGGNKIRKILLTCSGGPFFGYSAERLKSVTVEQALAHPNWQMGRKITTDSATLMNKGLEMIEAAWLFGVTADDIEVLIHRQSVLHSAVEFEDGSVIGQMGVPDMRIPIQFALTYPERTACPAPKLSLADIGTLTFEKPDEEAFAALSLARKCLKAGGCACTVLNSANEAAVGAFLERKIPFYRIAELVSDAVGNVKANSEVTLKTILDTEAAAREYVLSRI